LKKAKAKPFKPTPISRLRHYRYPLKMVGDPQWSGYGPKAWRNREKAVYEYEMDRKGQDNRGWPNATYYQAFSDNERINYLLINKWDDYKEALLDQIDLDYEEALRDNAAWEYHHENFIAA